jgi:hypothetical protein
MAWIPDGGEAEYSDGALVATGNAWLFLELLWELPQDVAKSILGTAGTDPTHCLLLDRLQRDLYLATVEEADQIIADQWPSPTTADLAYMLTQLKTACPTCEGRGWVENGAGGRTTCPNCGGEGWL